LPVEERASILETFLADLDEYEREEVAHAWELYARERQLPPGVLWEAKPWAHWLIMSGRGFGKTRTGAQTVLAMKNQIGRVALVGRTLTDAMEVMVEGESGILEVSPPWDVPRYIRSKERPRLEWGNGARAYIYSSKNPDSLRGPQHGGYWLDELAAFYYLEETWDNLQYGLRLGHTPWGVVTTTPRPIRFLKGWLEHAKPVEGLEGVLYSERELLYVYRGSTYENLANLAPAFRQTVLARYEGTRKGRQEIHGDLLGEIDGALWTRDMIDDTRVSIRDVPAFDQIVVAIDPPGSKSAGMAGIAVVGSARITGPKGVKERHTYTLEDVSGHYSPSEWADAALAAYERWSANRIVAERNFGGDMVENTVRQAPGGKDVHFRLVNASRGKAVRAEPIVNLMEQGRDHHVGMLAELEDELCEWVPGGTDWSPNRLDAKVWGATAVGLQREGVVRARGQTAGAAA
jgi:phage terminase large subunit-like protein